MTAARQSGKYGKYIAPTLVLSDFLLLNLLFWLTYRFCYLDFAEVNTTLLCVLVNIAYLPITIWELGGHSNRAILIDLTALNALKAVGVHALFFLSMCTLTAQQLSLNTYLLFYAMMFVALPFWWMFDRTLLKRLRRHGRNLRKVVIVGTNQTARRLINELKVDPGYGYRVIGLFDNVRPIDMEAPYIGTVDKLDEFVQTHSVDEVFFTLSGSREEDLSKTVKIADDHFISFIYVPQISRYISRNFTISNLGTMPVLNQMRNPLRNPLNRMVKRSFDVVISSAFLIVSPVIFIPVAIGVKLSSPGPVFFKQQRSGYRGKTFKCWKFRTMRVNAQADSAQATANDSRKTRFGDFLRRTSIDELPQFINVWLGDMSVVGPRPHMLKHTHDYSQIISHYMVRHVVKPGITGWAQVCGYRGLTDEIWKMEKRVEHDMWYIEHWNIILDIKIIVRTVLNALRHDENAF